MVYSLYGSWCVSHTLPHFIYLQKTSFSRLFCLNWEIFLIPTQKDLLLTIPLGALAFTNDWQLDLKHCTCFLPLHTRVVHQVIILLGSLNRLDSYELSHNFSDNFVDTLYPSVQVWFFWMWLFSLICWIAETESNFLLLWLISEIIFCQLASLA